MEDTSIGPQVSFLQLLPAVDAPSDEAALRIRKRMPLLYGGTGAGNLSIAQIDAVNHMSTSFHATYGTGSAFMRFLSVQLTTSFLKLQSHGGRGFDRVVVDALDCLSQCYTHACKVLASASAWDKDRDNFSDSWGRNAVEAIEAVEVSAAGSSKIELDDEGDVSWFFDEIDTDPALQLANTLASEVRVLSEALDSSDPIKNNSSQCLSDGEWFKEICCGLQHCSEVDVLGNLPDGLAMPMQLAMQVAQHLWLNSSLACVNFATIDFNAVRVTTVAGAASNRSTVYNGSILCFSAAAHFSVAAAMKNTDGAVVYYRTATVCDLGVEITSKFVDGKRYRGQTMQQRIGNSQKVHELPASSTMRGESYLNLLQQQHCSMGWHYDAVLRLQRRGVELLCCTAAAADDQLFDACNCAGLTILVMAASDIRSVACLSGSTVVEDLQMIDALSIGNRPVAISHVLDICDSQATHQFRMTSDDVDEQIQSAPQQQEAERILLRICAVSSEGTGAHICSVLIAAPTAPIVDGLVDKFTRCLHRLRHVLTGGTIIPGAGAPELLCHQALEQMKRQSDVFGEAVSICQSCLLNYCCSVMINCGVERTVAFQHVDEIITRTGYALSEHGGFTNFTASIEKMDIHALRALQLIRIPGDGSVLVLDIEKIRLSAVRAACNLTRKLIAMNDIM